MTVDFSVHLQAIPLLPKAVPSFQKHDSNSIGPTYTKQTHT